MMIGRKLYKQRMLILSMQLQGHASPTMVYHSSVLFRGGHCGIACTLRPSSGVQNLVFRGWPIHVPF
jgi:hypothetical protein